MGATIRLWAAVAALGAIIAAVPAAVRGFGPTITDPHSITAGILSAAGPSIATGIALYRSALASGDFAGALALLKTGAELARGLAAAAIDGVRRWAAAAIDAVRAAGAARIDALNAEKAALEKSLAVSRELANVVSTITKFIMDLQLGGESPLTPAAKLVLAESDRARAVAAFALNPTAAAALALQQADAAVLAAMQLVWTKPSPEYIAKYSEIIAELEHVRDVAASFVTPEEEAVARLASIDAEIAAVEANTRAQIAAINAAADREIESINAQLASVMDIIAAEQARLLTLIIGELDPLKVIQDRQQTQIDVLTLIQRDLAAFVRGQPLPELQSGADYVRRGVYRLHEGEAVLPASEAASYRAGAGAFAPAFASGERAGGGTTVTIAPGAIVITGVSDPEKAGQAAMKELVKLMRERGYVDWR